MLHDTLLHTVEWYTIAAVMTQSLSFGTRTFYSMQVDPRLDCFLREKRRDECIVNYILPEVKKSFDYDSRFETN